MASIELCPLSTHLEDSEIDALEQVLSEAGSNPLDIDEDADSQLLQKEVDDDMLAELFDRLSVNDAACDVYVPPDFEDAVDIDGTRVGSAHVLLLALQELAEDLGSTDEDDDDEEDDEDDEDDEEYAEYEEEDEYPGSILGDDEDDEFDLKEAELRRICKVLRQGARLCIKRGVAMFINS